MINQPSLFGVLVWRLWFWCNQNVHTVVSNNIGNIVMNIKIRKEKIQNFNIILFNLGATKIENYFGQVASTSLGSSSTWIEPIKVQAVQCEWFDQKLLWQVNNWFQHEIGVGSILEQIDGAYIRVYAWLGTMEFDSFMLMLTAFVLLSWWLITMLCSMSLSLLPGDQRFIE